MSSPYKCVLILGATSGIGLSLAERFLASGSFVILTGRRKERLDSIVASHGTDKCAGIPFDIADLSSIPSFVASITGTYPALDLIFLNAGIQRVQDFALPSSISFPTFQDELHTNYTAQVAFTQHILPSLLEKGREGKQAGLLYTTSNLALVPLFRNPGYSASKAAMHAMVMSLRAQLDGTGVKVQELLPPVVQTELHDESMKEKGKALGMPLREFTEKAFEGIIEEREIILVAGMGMTGLERWEGERKRMFEGFVEAVKAREWGEE